MAEWSMAHAWKACVPVGGAGSLRVSSGSRVALGDCAHQGVLPSRGNRDGWIRTSDLSVPNRTLYQAEPRPDISRPDVFSL